MEITKPVNKANGVQSELQNNDTQEVSTESAQLVVDLSAMVNMLQYRTKGIEYLAEFFDLVWEEITKLGKFTRIDIVGDNYEEEHPLKAQTRTGRGSGTVVLLKLDEALPSNFGEDFFTEQ